MTMMDSAKHPPGLSVRLVRGMGQGTEDPGIDRKVISAGRGRPCCPPVHYADHWALG